MINDASAIDLDDLDDVQDPVIESEEPELESDVQPEPSEDFDLERELLSLQGISDNRLLPNLSHPCMSVEHQ